MSGSYFTHTLRPEEPLVPPPVAAPETTPPWWRKPIVLVAEAAVIVGVLAGGYFLVNHPVDADLLATPQCVGGVYRFSWEALPGTRFRIAELRRPQVPDAEFTYEEYVVKLVLPGTTKGDVVAVLYTENDEQLLAGSNGELTGNCT
jgi:hypothetical protein